MHLVSSNYIRQLIQSVCKIVGEDSNTLDPNAYMSESARATAGQKIKIDVSEMLGKIPIVEIFAGKGSTKKQCH